MIEAKLIDRIFKALDRQIGVHSGIPFSIVVCGGTALAALGLIRRTTKDVDVLSQDDSLEFKNILHDFLNKKGLSEIINRI